MSTAGLFAGIATELAPEDNSPTTKPKGYCWLQYGDPAPVSNPFQFEVTVNDEFFTMPTPEFLWDDVTAAVYNYTVDWGDGSPPEVVTSWNKTHEYTGFDGTALVSITGTMQCWRWGNFTPSTDGVLLTKFVKWGNVGLLEFIEMFAQLPNMAWAATDAPTFGLQVTGNETSLFNMFEASSLPTSDLSSWDVSSITAFTAMFDSVQSVTLGISGWNTVSATSMGDMFSSATQFNEDIGGWNMSSVTSMLNMLNNAEAFNQDISAWNVSSATTMQNMLANSIAFSVANYDLLLNAWSLLTLNSAVPLAVNQNYTTASSQAAHDVLTGAPNNWVINDLGGV